MSGRCRSRELTVANGVITHAASGRTTTYGKVAAAAAKLDAARSESDQAQGPEELDDRRQAAERLDTADKLNGSKVYAIDVKLPGMLYATIKDCPVFGGKLKSYRRGQGRGHAGRAEGRARQRLDRRRHRQYMVAGQEGARCAAVVWDEGPNAKVSSASIAEHLKSGLTATDAFAGYRLWRRAKAHRGRREEDRGRLQHRRSVTHATMEPMNCTARYHRRQGEVWLPTQNARGLARRALDGLGTAARQMRGAQVRSRRRLRPAHRQPGLSCGRRWRSPSSSRGHPGEDAVDAAKRTRRTAATGRSRSARLAAGLDAKGNLVGLHIRVSGQSINAFANPAAIKDGKDVRQLQGLCKQPGDAQLGYTVPNMLIEYAMRNTHVPVGPWRGVNTNQNGIFLECFMDEAREARRARPVEFRRALMQNHPKHLGVLEAAAKKADWGKPLPQGVHRGIAQFMGYASYSAGVAEVSVSPKGEVKIHRLVLASDCGHAVNPAQIAAQVEGAALMGMSTLLSESRWRTGG